MWQHCHGGMHCCPLPTLETPPKLRRRLVVYTVRLNDVCSWTTDRLTIRELLLFLCPPPPRCSGFFHFPFSSSDSPVFTRAGQGRISLGLYNTELLKGLVYSVTHLKRQIIEMKLLYRIDDCLKYVKLPVQILMKWRSVLQVGIHSLSNCVLRTFYRPTYLTLILVYSKRRPLRQNGSP
jgi:hypothetical protein